MLAMVGFSACSAYADNSNGHKISLNNDWRTGLPTNVGLQVKFILGTNGQMTWSTNVNYWQGTWKEGTNGLRVQLKTGGSRLTVEVGSVVRNAGGFCFSTPNGKFDKFELMDNDGIALRPKPSAGTRLHTTRDLVYPTNLPAWAAPSSGTLVADFPKTISTNVYPLFQVYSSPRMITTNIYPYVRAIYPNSPNVGDMAGSIGFTSYGPPACISSLNLNEQYLITNEGDYTLTVQPVLYMHKSRDSEYLDRVDLPSVTTKFHLFPNVK